MNKIIYKVKSKKEEGEKRNASLNPFLLFNFYFFLVPILFTFAFLLFPCFASSATLSKPSNNLGLVGYWSFDDATSTSATDFSGNGNTGTLTNMANPATATSGWGVGKLKGDLNFDGTDDYVSIPNQDRNVFSISLWVKRSHLGAQWGSLGCNPYCDRLIGGNTNSWGIGFNSDNTLFLTKIGVNNTNSTVTISDTTNWHHVVVSYSGSTANFYIDGVLVNSNSYSSSFSGSGNYAIGTLTNSLNQYFGGSIDEVRIYNRALSATEIVSLYNTGAQKISVFNPSKIGGLVTWLKADAITGLSDGAEVATWTDSSGSGNDATQASAGVKPLYKTSILNGNPVVRFDGSNDYLSTPSVSVGTVFVVADWSGAATFPSFNGLFTHGGYETLIGNSGTSNLYNAGTVAGLVPTRYIDGQATVNIGTLSAWHTYEFAANVAAGVGNIGRDRNFSGRYWNGDVAEIIVYNTKLSDIDRRRVEAYLNAKYAINATSTVPTRVNASRNVTGSSLDSGLVGLWSFDGKDMNGTTAYDRSGSGNNGTLTNGPVPAIGKMGQGLSFDGVDDYMTSGTSIGNFSGDFTVSTWFKTSKNSTVQYLIQKRGSCAFTSFWALELTTGGALGVELDGSNSGNYTSGSFGSGFNNGQWHLATIARSGSTVTLYVDGISLGTVTNSSTYSNASSLLLGTDINAGACSGHWLQGSLDEIRLYNRALSASEVTALYNLGK